MSDGLLFITGIVIGWTAGSSIIWWWFRSNKLIRSREEWYRARNGKR